MFELCMNSKFVNETFVMSYNVISHWLVGFHPPLEHTLNLITLEPGVSGRVLNSIIKVLLRYSTIKTRCLNHTTVLMTSLVPGIIVRQRIILYMSIGFHVKMASFHPRLMIRLQSAADPIVI